MRRSIIILMMAISSLPSLSQEHSGIDAIFTFLGAASAEEIDPDEVERLQNLLTRPVAVNLVPLSRLVSSGIFTAYQTASLDDYRRNYGDVLSFSELAAVDGFGSDFVRRAAPFISLESSSLPGTSSSVRKRASHDLAVRTGLKFTGGEECRLNYGLKYRMEVGDRLSASFSTSCDSDDCRLMPTVFSGHLAWNFRRHSARLVLGDFNARFGQGLVFWNGMVLSGLSSPSTFLRRASGISGSWSFTGSSSLTGVAFSSSFGKVGISAAFALPGKTVANLTWNWRSGQMSFTNYAAFSRIFSSDTRIPQLKTSADMRFCLSGTDVYSEVAFDWVSRTAAALAGANFMLSEDFRMASMLRFYPPAFSPDMSGAPRSGSRCSNEYAATLSGELNSGAYVHIRGKEGFGSSVRRHHGVLSLDAVYFPESKSADMPLTWQLKGIVTWEMMLTDYLQLAVRLNERMRNWEDKPFRTDFRVDVEQFSRHFTSTVRFNIVNSVSTSLLAYAEGGFHASMLSLYLRQGLFLIDHWEDRIYVYERDAPGSFNVPVRYGRGVWTSITAAWKFPRWGRIYLRAGLTAYPFMGEEQKKPGKAELKLQYVLGL